MPDMHSAGPRRQYCTYGIVDNASYATWYCMRVPVDCIIGITLTLPDKRSAGTRMQYHTYGIV